MAGQETGKRQQHALFYLSQATQLLGGATHTQVGPSYYQHPEPHHTNQRTDRSSHLQKTPPMTHEALRRELAPAEWGAQSPLLWRPWSKHRKTHSGDRLSGKGQEIRHGWKPGLFPVIRSCSSSPCVCVPGNKQGNVCV